MCIYIYIYIYICIHIYTSHVIALQVPCLYHGCTHHKEATTARVHSRDPLRDSDRWQGLGMTGVTSRDPQPDTTVLTYLLEVYIYVDR